jgi:hypothetical protein
VDHVDHVDAAVVEASTRLHEGDRRHIRFIEILHLTAVSSFAIAQPVLDLLGRNPTFLLAHKATALEIALLLIALVVGPVAAIVLIESLCALVSPRLREVVHTVAIGGLGGLAVSAPLARSFNPSLTLSLVAYLLLSFTIALAYHRIRAFRETLTWLSISPLIFVGLFLLNPSITQMVFSSSGGSVTSGATSKTPVVLVVLDEFPLSALIDGSGQINSRRFPGFARLADASTWYPNATAVHPESLVAVPTILTGRLPERRSAPTFQEYPQNVFTLLGGSHEIRAREAVTYLCPPDLCESERSAVPLLARTTEMGSDVAVAYMHSVLPENIGSQILPSISDGWSQFGQPTLTTRQVFDQTIEVLKTRQEHAFMDSFLRILSSPDVPTLYYLHSLLPHGPWRYLPTGQIYENDFIADIVETGPEGIWRDGRVYTDQATQRLLLQTMYVDRFVGQLIDKLQTVDLWDSALVIVVADHGVSLEPGLPRRRFTLDSNGSSILPIPMFVKLPGQVAGRVDPRVAQTHDILPTIVDVLDLAVGWEMDGLSLVGPAEPSRTPQLITASGIQSVPEDFFDDAVQIAVTNEELFGDGSGEFDVFAMGQYRDLVGTRLNTTNVTSGESGVAARISGVGRFRDVRADPEIAEARVTGSISGLQEASLALALNGTVVSVAATYYYPEKDEWRFSFLVPPSLIEDGCNPLALYRIDSDGESVMELPVVNSFRCD